MILVPLHRIIHVRSTLIWRGPLVGPKRHTSVKPPFLVWNWPVASCTCVLCRLHSMHRWNLLFSSKPFVLNLLYAIRALASIGQVVPQESRVSELYLWHIKQTRPCEPWHTWRGDHFARSAHRPNRSIGSGRCVVPCRAVLKVVSPAMGQVAALSVN